VSAVWQSAGGPDPPHVDDELLRMRQLRGAMVGGAQVAPRFHAADGITSSLPMAVIDISRPVMTATSSFFASQREALKNA
jgi:hypothetical protein